MRKSEDAAYLPPDRHHGTSAESDSIKASQMWFDQFKKCLFRDETVLVRKVKT